MKLEGKRVIVTGGTRGLGRTIAVDMAKRGARVAITYSKNEDDAAETRSALGAAESLFFKGSVADAAHVKETVAGVLEAWGGVDVLVNNAAINRGDNFATTTDRAWDEVIGTNVNSLFAVTKPIYKQMIRQRKGSILNITSIGAIRSLPTSVHYATSKAAMIGFTKCLSREASNFGVSVNAIAAGIFDTDLAHTLPEHLLEMHKFWVRRGDLGRPAELAEFAAFMVSDRNSFMNGEVVIIDGGAVT